MQHPIKRVDSKGSEFIWKNSESRRMVKKAAWRRWDLHRQRRGAGSRGRRGLGINVANPNAEQAEPVFFFFFFNSVSKANTFFLLLLFIQL